MALDKFRANKASPDYTYMTLAAMLILFGLVMISSSSIVVATEKFNNSYGFVLRQAVWLAIGLVAFVFMSRIEYRLWKKIASGFLLFSLLLLLVVFIPGIGKTALGAARWISIGSFQLQPSEIAKLSLILYLSTWFEKKGPLVKTLSQGLFPFFALMIPITVLLILQHDMGTLMVILITCAAMFYMAGATPLEVVTGIGIGIMALLILIAIAPYRMQRLETFLGHTNDKLGTGYHANQLNIAIGSGGFLGRGFGQSLQKYLYLPEPQTDSIFAITVEELGFFRTLIVLLLIALFIYRGYQIASRSNDPFAKMVVFGITTSLFVQSAINISAALGLVPLTGVPLPFISYGGTSLISSLIGVGLVVNISRYRLRGQ